MKEGTIRQFVRAMYFMKPRIWRFSIGILGMSIFYASISVVESFMVKNIIDATVSKDMSLMTRGITLIIAAAVAIIVFVPIFQYMYNACAKEGLADAQKAVFSHRSRLPIRYFELHHSGHFVSALLNDAELMSGLYTAKIRRLTFPFIYGTAAAVPMFILDWKISLVLVVINSFSLYVNTKFSQPIRKLSDLIQSAASQMTERLFNMIAGIQIMKLFRIGALIQRSYEESNQQYAKLSIARAKLGALLSGVNSFLGMSNNLGLLLVGAWLASINLTTFGTLFALMSLQRRLNQAFLQVGEYIPQVQDSLAGSARIYQFLDEPQEPDTYPMPAAGLTSSYIEMKDIVFRYEDTEPILNKFNLSVSEGQTVALVGASGSGKSTAIKLLLAYYPPDSGTISVRGKSLGEQTLSELRSLISYVPQDAYVFNGTIAENIRYGRPEASSEEVIAAAEAANAHEFIMQQPQGYETSVGERGSRLSGGQRQRIAIARAFLKNSPILLLDEATSALDSESERQVQDALTKLMQNRTTIVIAHRLSTIERADQICVIHEGSVVEKGSHLELLNLKGEYYQLFQAQFQYAAQGAL
jgi:ATP-binding cassette, subfamily B, bacterial